MHCCRIEEWRRSAITIPKNIFRSVGDSVAYFLLYFSVPLGQAVVLYITGNDTDMLLFLLLYLFGVLYDSFGRYGSLDLVAKKKIKAIILVVAALVLITIILEFLAMNGVMFSHFFYFFYLGMLIPGFICVFDGMNYFDSVNQS